MVEEDELGEILSQTQGIFFYLYDALWTHLFDGAYEICFSQVPAIAACHIQFYRILCQL